MSRRLTALLVAVAGLALLLGVQLVVNRERIEDDLTARSLAALQQAGFLGLEVTFSGRDGRLDAAISTGQAAAAAALLRELDGVRVISIGPLVEAAEPAEGAAEDPADDEPGDGDGSTGGGGGWDSGDPSDLPAAPIMITVSSTVIVVQGSVATESARQALVAALSSAAAERGTTAPEVQTDDLDVDGRLEGITATGTEWLDRLTGLVTAIPAEDEVVIDFTTGILGLTGTVGSEEAKRPIMEAAAVLVPSTAEASDGLLVEGADEGGFTIDRATLQDQLDSLPRVTFEHGSARLTPEGERTVAEAADLLANALQLRIRIEGHTDSVGPAAANLLLSEARADAVRKALVDFGVDDSRLGIRGLGETEPLVEEASEDDRAQNRRVEFVVR